VSAAALAAVSSFAAAVSTAAFALSAAADAGATVVSVLASELEDELLQDAKIAAAAKMANTFFIVLVV